MAGGCPGRAATSVRKVIYTRENWRQEKRGEPDLESCPWLLLGSPVRRNQVGDRENKASREPDEGETRESGISGGLCD
jgi:hypothetical protein